MKEEEVNIKDTSTAFKQKSNDDLKFSYFLFRFMNKPIVVSFFSKLTLLAIKLRLPVDFLIKKTIFKHFCGGESILECNRVIKRLKKANIRSILDYSSEGKATDEDFDRTATEIITIIREAENNDSIPYTCLKVSGIGSHHILQKANNPALFRSDELEEWKKTEERLNKICKAAFEHEVPLYIDAEESWIQEPIDRITLDMMRKYNKEKDIISITLQMYRWDRLEYLNHIIKLAKKEGFIAGVKLVRGAYLEKERKFARDHNTICQVYDKKEETDHDFNKALDICIENIDRVSVCCGTHNEESCMHMVRLMRDHNIPSDHPHAYFSQLYGMSDHISFNLAAHGYNVTKYLPYGPIKTVIPYLIRRAEENTSIGGQMGRELGMIREEMRRRGI